MHPTALLSWLLLVTGIVHASSLSRVAGKAALKISSRINKAGFTNIVEKDRARIRALGQGSHLNGRDAACLSTSIADGTFYYTAEVGIGTPPTYHTLLIDTGSANTWVGAKQGYVATSSSVDTGNTVHLGYGTGAFEGKEWTDTVTLAPGLVIEQQSIGVAQWAQTPDNYDGILGVGPVDLTQGSVSNTYEVPTVMDNLYVQGKIPEEVLGVFYTPTAEPNNSGTLTFGGVDDSVITSAVEYVPLTTSPVASPWWGINQTISYGETPIMQNAAGIVDTGTTLILIPSDAFQQYQSATGAIMDPATGLLAITPAQYANLQPLTFQIGSGLFSLTPNGQIWPRSLNAAAGGNASAIYLVVSNIGDAPGGPPFEFCNGYSFMQRFYSVFDTTNRQFGIAETIYTNSMVN